MHIAYIMPPEEDRIRVNGRVPRELYVDISTHYANITTAINDAFELLRQEKTGQLHKDCGINMQNDVSSIQAQLDATHKQLEAFSMQLEAANMQIEFLKDQIRVKDAQIEKQAYHIQSLIQENVKLLPEKTEVKKKWFEFWK